MLQNFPPVTENLIDRNTIIDILLLYGKNGEGEARGNYPECIAKFKAVECVTST